MAAASPTTGAEHPRTARRAATAALALLLAAAVLLAVPAVPGAAPRSGGATPSPGEIMKRVFRAAYGPGSAEVDVILASPEYLRLTKQVDIAARFEAKRNFLFLMLEHHHDGWLGAPLRPLLQVDGGRPRPPARAEIMVDSSQHRLSVLVYARPSSRRALGHPTRGASWGRLEIVLPPTQSWLPAALVWTRADEGGGRP